MSEIWSNTDFPYMCLKDRARTLAFRRAIRGVVRPGDLVVDAGAGTGILSFFAAEAGAGRVYAVETDPLLVASLRRSVALNGLQEIITVVAGDAARVDLPVGVDVVIGELIDTGLMDEMQVPVLNALRDRGVIDPLTRLVPQRYTTFAALARDAGTFYGFRIAAPKHEWPFYDRRDDGWHDSPVDVLTDRVAVAEADFRGAVARDVDCRPILRGRRTGVANALKLSGEVELTPGIVLGPTNALNGDKILQLDQEIPIVAGQPVALSVRYGLGEGLASFRCRATRPAALANAS